MNAWEVLLGLLVVSVLEGAYAQAGSGVPLGLILGVVFSVVGVFFAICLPIMVICCVLCSANRNQFDQRRRVQVVQAQPVVRTYPQQTHAGPPYPLHGDTGPSYPLHGDTGPSYPLPAAYPAEPSNPTLTIQQPPSYSEALTYPQPQPHPSPPPGKETVPEAVPLPLYSGPSSDLPPPANSID